MEKIICENCGQEYDASLGACPICGHTNEQLGTTAPQPETAYTGAADGGQGRHPNRAKDENRIPTWLIAAICVILGLAIIIGAIYIMSSIGLFKSEKAADPGTATETKTAQTVPAPNETAAEPSPEEPVEADPYISGSDTQPAGPEQPQKADPDATDPAQPEEEPTEESAEEPKSPEEAQPEETGEDSETDAESAETTAEKADVSCESISLNRSDITLSFRGETFTFTPVVYPSSAADSIVWSSSDESLVTVNQSGTVNARVGTGSSYVTITAQCGDKKATCIVRCSFETADVLLALNMEDITFSYAGETAVLAPEDTNPTAETAITWSTSDPAVVSVDESGKLTAMGSGTAEITATSGTKTGKCIVRCSFGSAAGSADTYTLSSNDVTLFHAGESFTLSVTAAGGSVPEHTWSTSDASVCTVDADGKVTAVAAGTASILTTIDGRLLQCVVRVNITD